MQEAIALVRRTSCLMLPNQAAKDAGAQHDCSDARVAATIADYLKPGDSPLGLDAAANRLTGLTVHHRTAKDAVGMDVTFAALPDGIVYAATTRLQVAAQNLDVAVINSGYENLGG
jgi:hypothetical protein